MMKRQTLLFAMAVALLALAIVPHFLKSYGVYLLTYWLVYILAVMGLNLTVGYAGQKSLGHAAFFGIGAYTVAIMMKAGFSFWLGLPAAALLCFVTGIAVGFPALRVQTIYLAFATLGFNTAAWLVMRNEEWLTGGTFGINNIARPSLFGLSMDGAIAYYYFTLGVTIVFGLLLYGLLRSPWGKAFTSLRDNLIVAAQEHRGGMFSRMFAPGDSGLGPRADELIDMFRIRHVADQPAGRLSYGQQKLVDIAMAFMSEPDLVLLDEPCAGVNPSLVGGISTLLKQLNQTRKGSFVVIEHNMDFVMDVCHRIMVMVEGKVMAVGTPAEIRGNREVLDAYLGD